MGNAELQNKLQEWNNAFSSLMDKAPELIKEYILELSKGQAAPFIDLREAGEPIYGYINNGDGVMESIIGALAVIDDSPYILMANSQWDSLDDIDTDTLEDSVMNSTDDQCNGFIPIENASWYNLDRDYMVTSDTLANIIWNLKVGVM